MTERIFHIGIPKTASSFLQTRVFPQFEGITYVNFETIRACPAFNHLQLADDTFYDPDVFRSRINEIEGERVLFSDERLAGRFLGFGGMVNRSLIGTRLRDAVPDARILMLIRGQSTYLHSAYQQSITGHAESSRSFSDFIYRPDLYFNQKSDQALYDSTSLSFSLHYIFYYEMIRLYKGLFSDVQVLLYEDFVHDFESTLIRIEDFIRPKNSLSGKIDFRSRVNRSSDQRKISQLRYLNATLSLGRGWPQKVSSKLYREWMFRLNTWMGRGDPNPETQIQNMLQAFHENNRRLIEEFPEVGLQRYPQDYPTGD